jgi:hypothetical protein
MGKHSLREDHDPPTDQIPVTKEAVAKLGKHHVKPSPTKRPAVAPKPEPFAPHRGKLDK